VEARYVQRCYQQHVYLGVVCVNGDAARLWTHWLTVTGSAQFSSVQSNMNVLPSIVNRRLTNSTTDRQAQTSRDTTGNLTISIAL